MQGCCKAMRKNIKGDFGCYAGYARERLPLSIEDTYINSGVLLIDLLKWRENEITKKCIDKYKKDHKCYNRDFVWHFSSLYQDVKYYLYEYKWDETNKSYNATGGKYIIDENAAEKLKTRLSVRNAYAYYVIAIALGLIDSLGKNFVVRSWNADPNNGKTTKWWPAFYDMDSACGGSNDGSENVPETAYIDKYANSCT